VAHELKLEQLASEMEYGTVTRWLKREGEAVTKGEAVVEVEAEKASHEIDVPVSGTLAAILVEEGDEVKVGTTLALIETA
jgi:pyruvate/2-oxoglutarate dehydrogenase complex dihydrolipoamide acyltransferase (E2) component